MVAMSNKTKLFVLVLSLFILLGVGTLMVNSVAPNNLQAQVMYMVLGIGLMYVVSTLDYRLFMFSPWPYYLALLAILVITVVVGAEARGSVRWLEIFGVRLQTSEMAKPLIILFLANLFTKQYPANWKKLFSLLLLSFAPVVLVFIQPDLGTALILGSIVAVGLITAGIDFKRLFALVGIGLLLIPLALGLLKPYQRNRLTSFIEPTKDPLGTGYNAAQAMIAVGSGRLFGRGLGQGTQSQLNFLPERHTDFIFASLVEEMGFLGGMLIICAYLGLGWGLLGVARAAPTEEGSLVAVMVLSLILTQAFINMGMNMGIMPVTGITLPFVSVGGSSLISLCLMTGLCFSILRTGKSSRQTLEIK
jgi:rod shape determining protein RodA